MTSPLRIEHIAQIDSTNAELLRRAGGDGAAGEPAFPVFLVAARQSAGRGRSGRSWHSNPASALTASLGLDLAVAGQAYTMRLPFVPLAAGIAVVAVLERLRTEDAFDRAASRSDTSAPIGAVALKWPNDLVRVDRHGTPSGKAGGILCEARTTGRSLRLVVGIGLNLWPDNAAQSGGAPTAAEHDAPVSMAPATLFDEPRPALRNLLISSLAAGLLQTIEQCLYVGFESLRAQWDACDALRGRTVRVHVRPLRPDDAWQSWYGTANGIDASGALRVRRDPDGREICVSSDEVSVRAGPLRSPREPMHGSAR